MASNRPFEPFSLASVMQNAEALKSMKRASVMDDLQSQYLQGQIGRGNAAESRAQSAETRAQTEFSQEQQVTNTRLLNMAAAEVAQNPAAAQRWDPILKSAIPNWQPMQGADAAQIQAGAKQLFDSTSQALQAYAGSLQGQNNVQSTQVLDNGNIGLVFRDGTIKDTGQKVRPNIEYRDIGGVPTALTASGGNIGVQPLSTIDQEASGAARVAGAEATARAEGTASVVPADARESARNKLPRARAAFRRLSRVSDAVEDLADNMILKGGPFQSSLLSVTPEGQELDQAVAQLIPEITALTRVPGVGSQSDLEQRLANLSMPASGNFPEVNRRAITELETFLTDLEGAYKTIESGGQGQPTQNGEQQIPQGVDPELWQFMTPEERALWQ